MGKSEPFGEPPDDAPVDSAEEARLGALARTGLLDTAPEPEFDRITRLVTRALNVPMAAVSLIDRDRQWLKSMVGLSRQEMPRSESFCTHAVAAADTLAVPDATLDPRFADNPAVVGDPNVRFYLGVPLRTSTGFTLGALCAIDSVSRQPEERDIAIMNELAELVVDQIELRLAASTDGLTGAMQRMAFLNEASRDFARARRFGRPLSSLMLDADRFKVINDTFGHATGDTVLTHVVSRCKAVIRESDYIGRLGGEEFCVMLPDATPEAALEIAERIRRSVGEQPIASGAHVIGMTVSIGIAGIRGEDTQVSEMIDRADQAMYEAKTGGRNQTRIAAS